MRFIELRRREKKKKSAKRAARKAEVKHRKQQFELQNNRIGRRMEYALAEGLRIHEQLEEEQRFRAAVQASRRNMDGGLSSGALQRLPISTAEARELVYRWRTMFPAVDELIGEMDYASMESRTLASLPEGVSVYGLSQTEQKKATETQAHQGLGQVVQTQTEKAQSRRQAHGAQHRAKSQKESRRRP